jgi:hypothetical protein
MRLDLFSPRASLGKYDLRSPHGCFNDPCQCLDAFRARLVLCFSFRFPFTSMACMNLANLDSPSTSFHVSLRPFIDNTPPIGMPGLLGPRSPGPKLLCFVHDLLPIRKNLPCICQHRSVISCVETSAEVTCQPISPVPASVASSMSYATTFIFRQESLRIASNPGMSLC